MAMFDYKGRDARTEVSEAFQLARYSATDSYAALGSAIGITVPAVSDLATLPSGWRDLTAADLGVADSKVDFAGYFTGETSPFAQAKILGFYDSAGNLERLSVSFAATNDPGDIIDYLQLANGAYLEQFRYLLDATAEFARSNDVASSDVVVTGYSLGGSATNILAQNTADYSDGFYADSNFFGFSSPTIYDDDKILNFGGENDVVYRSVGDTDGALAIVGEVLINQDEEFGSSADNVVLFNDFYANPASPYGPFSLLNLPGGWNAHVLGLADPAVDRIARSSFYDLIERDSAVVVSQLNEATRGITWVEDAFRTTSSHFGDPAFVLGTETGDKLRDGRAGDYLDGFEGNDRFSLSTGSDSVNGGAGVDTVQLGGSKGDYQAYHLSDGTLYMFDQTGQNGLEELVSVERVEFDGATISTTYTVASDRLDTAGLGDIRYSAHKEGQSTNDTLVGTTRADAIFGLAGDDVIRGGQGNDLLHGGAGNDIIQGDAGTDHLFGGIGDDRLVGGAGNDVLTGGAGDDVFDFSGGIFGKDMIADFNAGAEGDDVLTFSSKAFANADAVLAAFHQVGDDAILTVNGGSITLADFQVEDLQAGYFHLV